MEMASNLHFRAFTETHFSDELKEFMAADKRILCTTDRSVKSPAHQTFPYRSCWRLNNYNEK
jgi:hypothetical protein